MKKQRSISDLLAFVGGGKCLVFRCSFSASEQVSCTKRLLSPVSSWLVHPEEKKYAGNGEALSLQLTVFLREVEAE